MQYGRLFLGGDAGVYRSANRGERIKSGGIGRELSVADSARIRHHRGRSDLLAAYSQLALDRVWKGERFSWFMTRLLHDFPDQNAFDAKMQAADRRYYLGSRAGLTTIAENYVGLPMGVSPELRGVIMPFVQTGQPVFKLVWRRVRLADAGPAAL